MNNSSVSTSRHLGWVLFIAGVAVLGGYSIYAIAVDDNVSLGEKLGILALVLGLGGLLFSVLRERLIARKTDRYKDVEL